MPTSTHLSSTSRVRSGSRADRVRGGALLEGWLARSGSAHDGARGFERAFARVFRRAEASLGADITRWLARRTVQEAKTPIAVSESSIAFQTDGAAVSPERMHEQAISTAEALFDHACDLGSGVVEALASEWTPGHSITESDAGHAQRLHAVCAATQSIASDRSFEAAVADALAALARSIPLGAMFVLESGGAASVFAPEGAVGEPSRELAAWTSLARLVTTAVPTPTVQRTTVAALGAFPRTEASEATDHVTLPLLHGTAALGAVRFELRARATLVDVEVLAAVTAQIAARLAASTREFTDGQGRGQRELLSVVSHDLRNPLSAILMSVALVSPSRRTRQHAHRSPEWDKHIAVIKRSAERMNQLIQNLVDAAHLDAGTLHVEPRPEPIADIITDAVRLLEVQAINKGIRLDAQVPEASIEVLADRERVVQTITNLVTAALRSTPRGGTVSIRATVNDDDVHVTVADGGPGFASGDLPHLFDRRWWSQRNASLSTGLALAVAKGIVEAHRGRIAAASTPGSGCTVLFTLPTAPADAQSTKDS